jgi:hypothetical protein
MWELQMKRYSIASRHHLLQRIIAESLVFRDIHRKGVLRSRELRRRKRMSFIPD